VTIRRLQPGDAANLASFYNTLSNRSRRTFRPLGLSTTIETCEKTVQDNLPDADVRYDLVAVDDGQIVGWSFLWDLGSDQPMFGLGIADHYQGQGLGSRLMDRVMAEARGRGLGQVRLTVVQDNDVARAMYERRGFVRCGAFTAEDGLDYFRMVAELRPVR
jgi:ribosomal protein S18 acetylase RimI-like enzyme